MDGPVNGMDRVLEGLAPRDLETLIRLLDAIRAGLTPTPPSGR